MLLKKELGVVEKSYYEASVTRRAPAGPLAERTRTDVCVVGGGYAGLSAALELADRGYEVMLLEAQRVGWGASGRNDAARACGVRVHENSPVFVVERGARPLVKTAQGECECRFVVLGGNVYLGEYGDAIAPEVAARIMPVGTYMIATEPLGRERADALMRGRPAASDTNFVLDYFRLSADDRLLFGGGDSYSAAAPRDVIARIRASMLKVFPQLADLDIPYAWGGFVDISMNKAPDFGRLGDNIYYLQGFSGHGLALAGMAGKLVALAIAGQAERFDLFSRIRHHAFPGGALLRTPALVLGMMYYRLRDAL